MKLTQLFPTLILAAFAMGTAQTTTPGVGTGFGGLGKGPAPVLLGTSGNYVILAKTGISTTGTTAIVGDLGISPAAGSFITGFSLLAPPTTYTTSARVTGKVYASDYDSPTPSNLTIAVLDMGTAYADAAARPLDYTELGTGNIGGMTLAPAVYRWSGNVTIPANVTLSGGANDVWIFQIAGNLSSSSAVRINLAGGAQPRNIFWQVAGAVSLGTTSHFEGVILAQTAIALTTGATANARLLTKTAATLDANNVTQPSAVTAISIPHYATQSFVIATPGSHVSFPLTDAVKSRISIMDVWGRTLLSTIVTPAKGNQTFVWDGKNSNGTRVAQGSYRAMITPLN